jgi:hypothetical protein
MAKRFIDTGLFDDPWFMDLTKDAKILWVYMITRCNHAGIIEINRKMIIFQTGIDDLDGAISELGNRLVSLSQQSGEGNSMLTVSEQLPNSMATVSQQLLYFIPKFITFQYPGFPDSKAKAQESAIKILEKYGDKLNCWVTLTKELPNSYNNGNGNGNGKKGGVGGNINGQSRSKIVIPR